MDIDPADTSLLTALSLPSDWLEARAPPVPDWVWQLQKYRLEDERNAQLRQKKVPTAAELRDADSKHWITPNDNLPPANGVWTRFPDICDSLDRGDRRMLLSRPQTLAAHQRHAIQLMSSLLSIRTNASPFTLVLDDLNQRAMPFLQEMVTRGISRNLNVVVVSFEATRFHPAVRHVPAHNRTANDILQDIEKAVRDRKESLVIIDNIYDAVATKNIDIAALFELVVQKFASTLVGVYHTDMTPEFPTDAYSPDPLQLLKFMATAIVQCRSLAHVLAAKAARERSLPEPTFGMLTGAEGVVQCLDANDARGIVLEAEFRRKSGRSEGEVYFLRPAKRTDFHEPMSKQVIGTLKQEFVILLEQHPSHASPVIGKLVQDAGNYEMESSFNLGLTDKQKAARDGVVLPYFDAQKQGGGEGGRILYDMGEEDDFDEEEDEI